MSDTFSKELLSWYAQNARELPWRGRRDPYAIWISEVMLQQTRVETVISYYNRWMSRFPTVDALACAEIDEILSMWEGLGYYQRAHHLHEAAKDIHEGHGGEFPGMPEELEKLPGIGPYTAAAIASIAFGEKAIALDGNLRRVISRLIDYDQVASTPKAGKCFRAWALERIPISSASEFNQALMDLGAMVCIAKAPACGMCPVSSHCESFTQDTQDLRPVRKKRPVIPHHVVSAGVLRRDGKVLIGRRPVGKLLGGLWEFPGGRCLQDEPIAECLVREWYEELDLHIVPGNEIGIIKHAYTHFKVTVHAIECHARVNEPSAIAHSEISWVDIDRLDEFPMGKVDRAIATLIRA